ncbi:hypothetical protein QJS66_21960 [Kocuria rhizophila]|nr:hypothetical protein QJS66_21960 [Kocuria rhizophila]
MLISPTAPTTAFDIGGVDESADLMQMYLNHRPLIPYLWRAFPRSAARWTDPRTGCPWHPVHGTCPAGTPACTTRPLGQRLLAEQLGRPSVAAPRGRGRNLLRLRGHRRAGEEAMSQDVLSFEEALERFLTRAGFEVHVELNTKTKMFDACAPTRREVTHTNTTPVSWAAGCAARGQRQGLRSPRSVWGSRRNCSIAEKRHFARKNDLDPGHPQESPDLAVRRAHRVRRAPGPRAGGRHQFRVEIERAHWRRTPGS